MFHFRFTRGDHGIILSTLFALSLFIFAFSIVGCGSTPLPPVKETVIVPQTVTVKETVTVLQTVEVPVVETVVFTQTVMVTATVHATPVGGAFDLQNGAWVPKWVAGMNGLGFQNWNEHRLDKVRVNSLYIAVIAWLVPPGKEPPPWQQMPAEQVNPYLPKWMRDYVPPVGYKLLWLVYPMPVTTGYVTINVPLYQVGADGQPLLDKDNQKVPWPDSQSLIDSGQVVFGLAPSKEDGGPGCGNSMLFYPRVNPTPTPTPTNTPTPGPGMPTVPPPTSGPPTGTPGLGTPSATPVPATPTTGPGTATSTPVPVTNTPPATATIAPSVTPTGQVICGTPGNPPCPPVATNTPAPATPTPLPTAPHAPSVTPTGQVICGTPGNPPCPPVPINTPAPVTPTPLPPVQPSAVPPTAVSQPPPAQPTAVPPTVVSQPPPAQPTAVPPTPPPSNPTSTPAPH